MTKESLYITSYCTIKKGSFKASSEINLDSPQEDLATWLLEAFKNLGCGYAKFYKMDSLSKLGFIASEIVLKPILANQSFEKQEVAIILSNSSSSLDTDLKYKETISNPENYFPSPGVFVYTLPNIVIGEICIRNKFMGESAFFVSEHFNPKTIVGQVDSLLWGNYAKACLVGWVEILEDQYEAAFYFIEKEKPNSNRFSNFEFNLDNLNHIYRL